MINAVLILNTKGKVMKTALALFLSLVLFTAGRAQTKSNYTEPLSKENAVLVYVDFLTNLDNYLTTVPGPQFRNNVTAFAKLNPIFKMPSIVLGDESAYAGEFYPDMKNYVTHQVNYFGRTTPSAYTPEVANHLKKLGRKKIVLGGISIDNCTLHTSLDLLRAGYQVYVLLDVSSTNNKLAEEAAIQRLIQAGAVPITWITLATELVKDWNSPEGAQLMKVLGEHLASSTVGQVNDPTPSK